MKIHCVAMVCVVIAGFVFHITPVEWCICLTLFGLVMALEMVNTAVEAVVDLVTEERKPLAKLAKDAAAGAVLIAAIMAAIAGMIIFIPKLLEFEAAETVEDVTDESVCEDAAEKAAEEETAENEDI